MEHVRRRILELERRAARSRDELDAIEREDRALSQRLAAVTGTPIWPFPGTDPGPAPSWVSTCRIRLVSGVHFPGGTAATWTDGMTPDFLRLWNTTTSGSCAVLNVVDNPTFGYPIMQWTDVPFVAESSSYVRWQLPAVLNGINAEVRLNKSDWSIQGAISFQVYGAMSGTQFLFAINWQLDAVPSPRMTAGTHGAATLDRATSPAVATSIKTITNSPPASGYIFDTLVEYHDTNAPTCNWGGTNPVIEVDW